MLGKKILCLSCVLTACFAYAKEDSKHTVRICDFRVARSQGGDVLFNFPTKYLPYKPKITVFLPSDYGNKKERYPVIYLAQGKCIFDEGLDKINLKSRLFKISNKLISEGKIKSPIIIDIELVGLKNCTKKELSLRQKYAKFLALELIPYIDLNYRTLARPEERLVIDRSFYIISEIPDSFGMSAVLKPAAVYLQGTNIGKLAGKAKLWFASDEPIYTNDIELSVSVKTITKLNWLLTSHLFRFDDDFVSFLGGFENRKDKNHNEPLESMLMYFFAKEPRGKITSLRSRVSKKIISKTNKNAEIIFGAGISFKNGFKAHYLSSDGEVSPPYLSHHKSVYHINHNAKPKKVKLKGSYGKRKFSAKVKIVE
jgi:hypothetical protein